MKQALMRKTFIFFLLIFTSMAAFSQGKIEVSGKITDGETGEALSGVSVSVINTAGLGTFSTKEGNFSIKVELYHKLLFSYIGYDTVEVLVKDQNALNIKLQKSVIKAMDEVVVTAVGPQKKINVTGAITSVDMDELRKSAATASVVNTLAGNVPGIMAMQTSGQPGKVRLYPFPAACIQPDLQREAVSRSRCRHLWTASGAGRRRISRHHL